MASSNDTCANSGEHVPDSTANESVEPTGPPRHMYPFSTQTVQSKRRQSTSMLRSDDSVQGCDQARPCLRCVKYGFSPEECVDSPPIDEIQRKERQKGAKRGPYKKRDGKGNGIAQGKESSSEDIELPTSSSSSGSAALLGSMPVGFQPGLFSQFPSPPGYRPGPSGYYSPVYFAPVAPSASAGQGENAGYLNPPQLFPATFTTPYGHPYAPYIAYVPPNAQNDSPSGTGGGEHGAPGSKTQ
ncbi:hypothetical protein R3P38DRAFT_2779268 [Favolaschia claudopus]|uniref:Uncharacterized protein n=1 Tax=Favolaschia claudopus TaxID=2862362 RepID=A0AAW0BDK7_9AGAR